MTAATPEAPAAPSQRFVEAALELFVENGYNGTSLQMIGDRLGVTKAAVTYHFRSKEELLAAVVQPALVDLTTLCERIETIRRDGTRRKEALLGYIDYLIKHRSVASWLSRDVAALTHDVVLGPAAELTARVDALLTAPDQDPITRVWGSAITQALTGPILTDIAISDAELRDELQRIGENMIRGYRATRRPRLAPTTTSA